MKVFINSIPKAGTNLVAKCLDLAGFLQAAHIGGKEVKSRIARLFRRFLDRPLIGSGYIVGINFPREVRRSKVNTLLKATQDRRYITAHVGYTEDMICAVKRYGFRVIVVVRDPRAVVASMVPYVLRSRGHPLHALFLNLKVEERYRIAYEGYTDEKLFFPSIATRYLAVEPWVKDKDVLVVKFEDFVGPKGGGSDDKQTETLKQICSHIGIPLGLIPKIKQELFGPGRSTFRKGQTDLWKEEIPMGLQERMNLELKYMLERWDYK